MKYIIFNNKGSLACEEINDSKKKRYIQSGIEFSNIIDFAIKEGFIVKKNKQDLILVTNSMSIKIENYKETLNHEFLGRLKKNIVRTIDNHGYINIQNQKNLKRKINRNNKHVGKTITKVTVFVLAVGTSINIFSSALKNVEAEKIESIPKESIVITAEDIPTNLETNVIYAQEETQDLEDIDNVETLDVTLSEENELPNSEIENTTASFEENLIQDAKYTSSETKTVSLEFEDLSKTEKAENARNNYYTLIEEKAKLFGVDSELMLGIFTQERGVHSDTIDDGGGIGIAQIQYSVWINQDINAYKLNSETGQYQKITLKVTDEMMRNLETNIELGCMVFQNCLEYSNYNIPIAIQMYNMGYGSIYDILNIYANSKGIEVSDVLSNPNDLGWLEFRYLKPGDPEYLENVNKWIEKNSFTVYNFKENKYIETSFQNNEVISDIKVI